jgi:HlyD family secretion protein
MTIADMSVIEAEISVDEADIVTVTLGAKAEVETDALRDVKMQGTVTEIGQSPIQPSSTGSNNNQNQEGKDFKVVVRLTSPPPVLRPGFTATADIVTATRTDCLVVPFAAIVEREVEIDDKGTYLPPPEPIGDDLVPTVSAARRQNFEEKKGVFVKVGGKARFRPVKQGIMGDMDVEVLEGLQPDEEVISGPTKTLQTLKEWDAVTVDEKKAAEDARRLRSRRR